MSKGSQPKHARKAKTTSPQVTPTSVVAEQTILSPSTLSTDTVSKHNDAGTALPGQQQAHAESSISPQAQDIVDKLNAVDERVMQLRASRIADPDTALDKLIGMAVPSLAGMIAGKVFNKIWNLSPGTPKKSHRSADTANVERNSLLMELLFAACSAAFVAIVTQLSDKSSRAVIKRLQQRRK